jgi:Putative restriction endonuclease
MIATPDLIRKPITNPLGSPIASPAVAWEKLPEDYRLDDSPVESLSQPLLSLVLREILQLAGLITADMLVATNFAVCATVNGTLEIKAPDWVYVARVNEPGLDRRSYTPELEGDRPTLVMEFLSYTNGDEYSSKPTHPVGKWFFYEQVLKVPVYVIFNPDGGLVECYRLKDGRYSLEQPNEEGWNWIPELNLFLGTQQNTRDGRTGYWLRWWTADREMLPWASETIAAKDQALEAKDETIAAKDQALEDARAREQQLLELLRSQGIDPAQS